MKQGYNLSVYTRDAKKRASFARRVDIVVGDLQDQNAIAESFQGADAVISALIPNRLKVQGDKPIMYGLINIVAAMKHAGVHRLIQVSTAAIVIQRMALPSKTMRACGCSRLSRTTGMRTSRRRAK